MIYKYIFKIIITLLFLPIGFTSCVDENIIETDTTQPDIEEDPIEGYSIGFKIQLDKNMSGNTRGAEDYENYIDTRNKFRVLFFTEDGQFLFGAVDRTITALGEQSGTGVASWYVRVPMNYLVDREGNPYDADEVKNYLRRNNFKVAVLANWPNNATLRSDIEDEDSGNTTEDTYIEREPKWGWKQSIFSDEKNEIKNINDLHHLVIDKNYNDNSSSNNRPSRREVYDFVMDGRVSSGEGTMGVKTDWVKMRDISEDFNGSYSGTFSDQQSAETWIRNNWDPGKKIGNKDNVYRNYSNIWQLWNFSGNYTASYDEIMRDRNNTSTGSMPPAFKSAWQNRNGNDLSKFLNDNPYGLYSPFTIDGLSFEPTTNTGNRCYAYVSGNNRGIVLKPAEALGGTENTNKSYIDEDKTVPSRGFLKFKAYSTGTYRIRYGALNGNATMVVQHNSNIDNKPYTVSGTAPQQMYYESGSQKLYYRDLSITGDPETIYIWNGNGQGNYTTGDLIIYSIEWISSKYLYDTDRIGIEPSEENPIPMYGVQNFTKLGNDWEEGTTFDISAARGQEDVKPISLIRSLAKVEVYLPQKAKHIYMRSMNRTSRCEPIDVQTPTNDLWSQNHKNGECEWFNIQAYDPGLKYYGEDSPPSKEKGELSEYKNWLSWFYGSWQEWEWDFSKKNVTVPASYNTPKYPHLFYPDINRSDFCHLIYVGYVAGKGHKYILYMPEKNISDPNYVGFKTSIPKVAHIEYRYDNNTDNLEDNECHRIYFTNYTLDTSLGPINNYIKNVSKDGYEIYERNEGVIYGGNIMGEVNHLQLHWPIMRNHIYEFIVNSSGHGEPTIRAKVKKWKGDTHIVEW